MTDSIRISGIEVLAKHGVLESEQRKAQMFRIDVEVHADLGEAGRSDELGATLDYSQLALQVREVVGAESHQLIETVAHRVADMVLEHEAAERVLVTVHKPDAPIDLVFDDVSVTVDRQR